MKCMACCVTWDKVQWMYFSFVLHVCSICTGIVGTLVSMLTKVYLLSVSFCLPQSYLVKVMWRIWRPCCRMFNPRWNNWAESERQSLLQTHNACLFSYSLSRHYHVILFHHFCSPTSSYLTPVQLDNSDSMLSVTWSPSDSHTTSLLLPISHCCLKVITLDLSSFTQRSIVCGLEHVHVARVILILCAWMILAVSSLMSTTCWYNNYRYPITPDLWP